MATPKPPSGRAGPIKNDDDRRRIINNARTRPNIRTRTSGSNRGTDTYFSPQRRQQRVSAARSGANREVIGSMIKAGGGKLSGRSRKNFESWFGTPWSGSSGSGGRSSSQSSLNQLSENLIREIQDTYTEQTAIQQEYNAQNRDLPVVPTGSEQRGEGVEGEDYELVNGKKVWVNQPSIDEQFLGGHVGKVLDYSSRPLSALAGGLNAAIEGETPEKNFWDKLTEAGSNFAWGAGGILTGETKERPGWGKTYEVMKAGEADPENPNARFFQALEEKAPWIDKALGYGFGSLDLITDPTNVVGGTKAGVIAGEVADANTMRRYADQIADRISREYDDQYVQNFAMGPGGYNPYPSQQAIKDYVYKELERVLASAENEISAGGSKGRYEVLSPRLAAEIAAAHGAQAVQDAVTVNFRARVQKLLDGIHGRGTKLNGQALQDWADLNPDFTDFLDEAGAHYGTNSYDELAQTLSPGDDKTLRNLEQDIIQRKYAPGIQKVSDDIARDFTNNYYNAPAIRVGNKKIPIKAVGRAYSTVGNKLMGKAVNNFRYNATFPGTLSIDATRARAYSVPGMESFEKLLRTEARKFSKSETIEIQHAMDNNLPLSPKLQEGADWIRSQYDEMYEAELEAGVRGRVRGDPNKTPTTVKLDTYTFVYNRGRSKTDRTTWKANRKGEINDPNIPGAGRFKTENAAKDGYKPHENAFEALRQRRIKHNRDMTRAFFRTDMVDKYGIFSKLDSKGKNFAAESRGLQKIPFNQLPEHLRQIAEKEGGDYFLPKQMKEMLDYFDEVTQWNGAQQGQVARAFTKVMGILKTAMTLPWTGFHIKNMVGDIFMGLMDHVNVTDYARVTSAVAKALAGKKAVFKFAGGLEYSLRDMWNRYQIEANSGFANAELTGLTAPAKYNIPKRMFHRGYTTLKDISAVREDLGRFTHYVTAFRQEAKALYKKGIRDPSVLDAKAGSATLWRVNNYRFDYNAINLWEKKVKTLAFPFYTFLRKAAPALVQAIYQDPRWINQWTRYMYQNSIGGNEETGEAFDEFRVPEDIRMMGYAMLGEPGEDEPWAVTNDILPTGVLNSVRTDDFHEFSNSILGQFAAPGQMFMESATEKDLFQDKPMEDQSLWESLKENLPGVREYRQATDPNATWMDRLINHRTGLGLPIREISENQQEFAQQQWQDKLIDDPTFAFNRSQDLFFIAPSQLPNGQRVYVVKDNRQAEDDGTPGRVVQKFYTVQEAIDFAKKLVPQGYKQVETVPEFDNQGNLIERPVGR